MSVEVLERRTNNNSALRREDFGRDPKDPIHGARDRAAAELKQRVVKWAADEEVPMFVDCEQAH